jgi:hypothetical protein
MPELHNALKSLTNWIPKLPWVSGTILPRSGGNIVLNKNGDFLDMWVKVNGEKMWFAIPLEDLGAFLAGGRETAVLEAESSCVREEGS